MQIDTEPGDFDLLDERHSGTTVLRSVQLVELRLLKVLDHICTKHSLVYWLDGGTLLGAVRHGGFIPWDDDIDIAMPRKDFDQFIEIARAELPDDLEIETATDTDDAHYSVPCRIRDLHSRIINTHSKVHRQRGIFIDILPIDEFHRGAAKRTLERFMKFLYRNLLRVHSPPNRGATRPAALILHWTLETFSPIVTSETPIKAFRLFVRTKFIQNNRWKPIMGDPGYGFDVKWARIFDRADIYPITRIRFENAKFCAPHNPDGVLKVFYGRDYMTLPPPSKRAGAHFTSVILDTRVDMTPVPIFDERSGEM
jgi:lipopolysaccharide cholinephosphotransferase